MFAITYHQVFDFFIARIDEGAADNFLCCYLCSRLIEFQHVAVLEDNNVLRIDYTRGRRPISMPVELAMLAVNRDEKPGPRSFDQDLQILLASVTRDVNACERAIDHLGTAFVAMRDPSRDRRLIAGNLPSRK